MADLHIIKGRIEAGINGQIELFGRVVGKGDARCRGLGVVYKDLYAAEGIDGLLYDVIDNSFVIGMGADIGDRCKDLYAVFGLKLFLCVDQLLLIPSGDDKVGALFCICRRNAIADRTATSVAEDRASRSCDYGCFTL